MYTAIQAVQFSTQGVNNCCIQALHSVVWPTI